MNDNAPYLDDPKEVQVIENSKPQVVARVKLGDPDNWRQGHGPPFTIHLDPRAPPHIKAAVKVKHDKSESSFNVKVTYPTQLNWIYLSIYQFV